jgi:V8-like Glu-specific endopeptidase
MPNTTELPKPLLILSCHSEEETMTTTSLQEFIKSVREQIAEGEVELALDRLQNYFSASAPKLRNEIILHTAKYNRLRREERKGVITRDTAQAEQNKLVNALLELLEEASGKICKEMLPSRSPASLVQEVTIPDEVGLERILGANNLKQISWIARGLQVSRSVCRVLTPTGLGTGFLITPGLMMTNNHVIPTADIAAESVVEFNYQHTFEGNLLATCRYKLDTGQFYTNPALDYTVAGVLSDPKKPSLESWRYLLLNPHADPVPGEHVVIIQHPNGGLKQIVLTANQVVGLWDHRLHYTTDTMPGSSGSPVFNDLWQVIAIHHAGGDLQVNTKGDKRFINEGILMSAIRSDGGSFWPG